MTKWFRILLLIATIVCTFSVQSSTEQLVDLRKSTDNLSLSSADIQTLLDSARTASDSATVLRALVRVLQDSIDDQGADIRDLLQNLDVQGINSDVITYDTLFVSKSDTTITTGGTHIEVLSNDTLLVSTSNPPKIFQSVDGGVSFDLSYSPSTDSFTYVDMMTSKDSVVFAYLHGPESLTPTILHRSLDYGTSFISIDPGISYLHLPTSLTFVEDTLLVTGTGDSIYLSGDLGNSWVAKSTPGNGLGSVANSGDSIWVIDNIDDSLYFSENNGTNWENLSGLSTSSAQIYIDSITNNLIYTDNTSSYISTNFGSTWTELLDEPMYSLVYSTLLSRTFISFSSSGGTKILDGTTLIDFSDTLFSMGVYADSVYGVNLSSDRIAILRTTVDTTFAVNPKLDSLLDKFSDGLTIDSLILDLDNEDVSLYRGGADTLSTTDTFTSGSIISNGSVSAAGGVSFDTGSIDEIGMGTGTLPTLEVDVRIAHGLSGTPDVVLVTSQEDGLSYAVTAVDADSFTVDLLEAAVGGDVDFFWLAIEKDIE